MKESLIDWIRCAALFQAIYFALFGTLWQILTREPREVSASDFDETEIC